MEGEQRDAVFFEQPTATEENILMIPQNEQSETTEPTVTETQIASDPSQLTPLQYACSAFYSFPIFLSDNTRLNINSSWTKRERKMKRNLQKPYRKPKRNSNNLKSRDMSKLRRLRNKIGLIYAQFLFFIGYRDEEAEFLDNKLKASPWVAAVDMCDFQVSHPKDVDRLKSAMLRLKGKEMAQAPDS